MTAVRKAIKKIDFKMQATLSKGKQNMIYKINRQSGKTNFKIIEVYSLFITPKMRLVYIAMKHDLWTKFSNVFIQIKPCSSTFKSTMISLIQFAKRNYFLFWNFNY